MILQPVLDVSYRPFSFHAFFGPLGVQHAEASGGEDSALISIGKMTLKKPHHGGHWVSNMAYAPPFVVMGECSVEIKTDPAFLCTHMVNSFPQRLHL